MEEWALLLQGQQGLLLQDTSLTGKSHTTATLHCHTRKWVHRSYSSELHKKVSGKCSLEEEGVEGDSRTLGERDFLKTCD